MFRLNEEALLEANTTIRLKLQVYRSLGINVETDKAGNYNKAIIRNAQKGDVHVVNIGPQNSDSFYANYLWDKL